MTNLEKLIAESKAREEKATPRQDCLTCHGSGYFSDDDGKGLMPADVRCPDCNNAARTEVPLWRGMVESCIAFLEMRRGAFILSHYPSIANIYQDQLDELNRLAAEGLKK